MLRHTLRYSLTETQLGVPTAERAFINTEHLRKASSRFLFQDTILRSIWFGLWCLKAKGQEDKQEGSVPLMRKCQQEKTDYTNSLLVQLAFQQKHNSILAGLLSWLKTNFSHSIFYPSKQINYWYVLSGIKWCNWQGPKLSSAWRILIWHVFSAYDNGTTPPHVSSKQCSGMWVLKDSFVILHVKTKVITKVAKMSFFGLEQYL